METATATEPTARQRAEAVMTKHGLAVTAVFVPWSQSRHKDEKETDYTGKPTKVPRRSLNWRVTLTQGASPEPSEFAQRFGKPRAAGRVIVETDYSAGIGHCPSYKQTVWRMTVDEAAAIEHETEKGYSAKMRGPILPDPVDVLHSLVLDTGALDAGTFEEWAGNLGYDTDSREAERIYLACLEIALKVRHGLGEAVLAELRAALQDL